MSLYIKQVLIRPNSATTFEGAVNWTKNWLDSHFQEVDSNKDENGDYIDYFAADIFDARNGDIYRIFTNAAKNYYNMPTERYEIISSRKYVKFSDITDDTSSIDYMDENSRKEAFDTAVMNRVERTKLITESIEVSGDKIEPSSPVHGDIVSGSVLVAVDDFVVDEVPVTLDQNGNIILSTNNAGEYDGREAIVTYFTITNP